MTRDHLARRRVYKPHVERDVRLLRGHSDAAEERHGNRHGTAARLIVVLRYSASDKILCRLDMRHFDVRRFLGQPLRRHALLLRHRVQMHALDDRERRNLRQLAGQHILNRARRSRRVGIVAEIHNRDADALTPSRFKSGRANSHNSRKYQKKNKPAQKRHEKPLLT